MDIEIRLARVEDRAEIIQLQSSSLRVLASKNYGPEQIESLVKSQAAARFNSEVIFVAIFQEKIVGFASLSVKLPSMNGIYVDPQISRQGIGSRLLEEVENAAIEKGYEVIYVLSSLTAIKFYKKRGYKLHSDAEFLSEGRVKIPCKACKKRLTELTATEKTNRLALIFTIASIVIVSIAIALL